MDEKTIVGLRDNSQSALLAAIEIHNKPIFPYRFEVCIILIINAWELLLKGYLIEKRPDIKIIQDDGNTRPFDDCVAIVLSTIGKDFLTTSESINKLYEYRCKVIHFYQDRIEVILYSLISKNIILYHEFLLKYFEIDISQRTNLVLLPIGFKRPISPIDYLSNESELAKSSDFAQKFIKGLVDSIHKLNNEGIEDSILVNYKMSLINENRIKNADVIAAITKDGSQASVVVENVVKEFIITNDEGAQKIRIEEENLFKTIFTKTYKDVTDYCQKNYSDYKMNNEFHALLREIKKNSNLHRTRYLDVGKETGTKKDYYSKDVSKELDKHYKRIEKR